MIFKVEFNDELRRFRMENESVTFEGLTAKLRELLALDGKFKLRYRDEDNDLITLTDTTSLNDAMDFAVQSTPGENAVLRLTVDAVDAVDDDGEDDGADGVMGERSAPPPGGDNPLMGLLQQAMSGSAGGELNLPQLMSNPMVQMMLGQGMQLYQQNVQANDGQLNLQQLLASPMVQSLLSMLQGMGQQTAAAPAPPQPREPTVEEDLAALDSELDRVLSEEAEDLYDQPILSPFERDVLEQLKLMGFEDESRSLVVVREHNRRDASFDLATVIDVLSNE